MMKKYGLIACVCALLVAIAANDRTRADVTEVTSYIKSQMVVEINAALTILNSVLDANNNIDASKVQGTYSDADASMTVSNLVLNGGATVAGNIAANGNVVGDGSTVVSNIATFYAGSSAGQSVTVTNIGFGATNILVYTGGILTSATVNP